MIIVLNGTSSSGKTSVATELQDLLPELYLYFSIDAILYALPKSALLRMTTGQAISDLNYRQLEESYYRCVRTLAEAGHNLIIDNTVTNERAARLLIESVRPFPTALVGIHCLPEELGRREKIRGDRAPGESAWQLQKVHQHLRYDLQIDSTQTSSRDLAALVVNLIHGHKYGEGLRESTRRLG